MKSLTMMMISMTTNYPMICDDVDIWAKIVKFYPFFLWRFSNSFRILSKFVFFFEKLSEVSKGFYPLIMPLSHFGENWELTFSGM